MDTDARLLPPSPGDGAASLMGLTSQDIDGLTLGVHRSLLAELLRASHDGVLVTSADRHVLAANPAFFSIWGFAPVLGDDGRLHGSQTLAAELELVSDPQAHRAAAVELAADPTRRDRRDIHLRDGRIIERHTSGLAAPGDQAFGRVWFFRDVTGERALEARLEEQANTDPLTGLANRRRFMLDVADAFAGARRRGDPLAVALIDLDGFKPLNDTLGHAAGDELLVRVGAAVTEAVRSADLLARLGGDEFAVLLPGTTGSGALRVGEHLRRAVGRTSVDDLAAGGARAPAVTASVGVAVLCTDDVVVEELVDRADESLYAAKRDGRDRVGPLRTRG